MEDKRQGPNPFFQDIISKRATALINETISIGYLKHPLLKGKFREYGIGKLLTELIPISFDIGSGIIQDCNGKQSKEIDLIIWNKHSIPPLLFGEKTGVYPIESCFYTVEIKSKLTTEELSKSIDNAKSILALNYLANYSGPIKGHPIRVLFAYASDLVDKNEFERYKGVDPNWRTNPIYTCICIIGKGYYTFAVNPVNRATNWLWFKPNNQYYEILGLVSGIINTLTGQYSPDYGYYLLFPEEYTEYGEQITT